MINVNALDNIIAVVVVILLLSLIVQAIQSVLKKGLKIKSRQIEDSLIDLFENVLNFSAPEEEKPVSFTGKFSAWLVRIQGSSPILRAIYKFLRRKPHPSDPAAHPDKDVRTLFNAVMKEFKDIGRVAQTGKQMLDSISKEDLKKVMGKVLPDTLLGDFTTKLGQARNNITALETALETINGNFGNLSGDGKAKFAALQQELAPLLNDLSSVFDGDEVSPSLLIENVLQLRNINLADVLAILGELQKKVATDLTAAKQAASSANPPEPGLISSLEALSTALADISAALAKLSAGLDAAVAPLRTKLSEVETWYDTVTQSFEERYTRGMKTWAIVISFLVVAYLNASVFDIYRNVVTNDALRNQLVQMGEERTKANEQRLAKVKEEAANAKNDQEKAKAAEKEVVTTEDIKKDIEEIRKQVATLSGFGFQPLTWQGVKETFNRNLWFNKGREGQEEEKDWGGWLNRRKEDFKTLAGWLVMTFLLSVGAPFWEDTLESLFGVKNLLRKGTKTRNVEAESGAGQPKP